MHATADTRGVISGQLVGRRVMRGVRSLGSGVLIRGRFQPAALERPNIGMHATRDTNLVIYFRHCGRARDASVGRLSMMMRHLSYVVIAVAAGFGLTLASYMVGGPLVWPALSLARLFAEDRGGESLLAPFLVVSVVLYAALVYVALWLVGRSSKKTGS
jgi:hypothetical protein